MYARVRGYLFSIPTTTEIEVDDTYGTVRNVVVSGWDSGAVDGSEHVAPGIVQYINAVVTNADMRVRLIRLWSAIERCIEYDQSQSYYSTIDPASVLKVFVAPEFYFAPTMLPYTTCAHVGAYTRKEFTELYGALRNLILNYQAFHENQQLKHWVFLCGTVVFDEGTEVPRRMLKNVMIAIGKRERDYQIKLIRKMTTSGIDGIAVQEDYNYQVVYGNNQQEIDDHYLSLFHMFVEICLEHRCGLLADAKISWAQANRNCPVQLQVISAAGMTAITQNVEDNAIVLRSDGYRYSDNRPMVSSHRKTAGNLTDETVSDIGIVDKPWNDINVNAFRAETGATQWDVLTGKGSIPLIPGLYVF